MGRKLKTTQWTNRAHKDYFKLLKFYKILYGLKKAKEIGVSIIDNSLILENKGVDVSKMGAIDEQFEHLQRDYRKIYSGHCKITYREGRDHIYIIRVFDTRQNPNKNI